MISYEWIAREQYWNYNLTSGFQGEISAFWQVDIWTVCDIKILYAYLVKNIISTDNMAILDSNTKLNNDRFEKPKIPENLSFTESSVNNYSFVNYFIILPSL